ncbi:MAG TPA: hypothetical protein VLM11_15570 [Streptosporangiaceae bacterium]|nr:hypothetical protein [Streptosporangiaceae bacterium]
MQRHEWAIGARHLLTQLRRRLAAIASSDTESGALSLEWVAIAIVLVAAALALATFLAGKLSALEALIPR